LLYRKKHLEQKHEEAKKGDGVGQGCANHAVQAGDGGELVDGGLKR
jgi:hypothetical protein